VGICWWDARRKRVNTVQEVTGLLRLHLIGSLPLLPERVHRRLSSSAAHADWNRLLAEAVDSIREMLISEGRIRPVKVILITSAMVGEGKTTAATQLAMSFARANKRTVIVDFDLRRPATHVALGKPADSGIAEVLRGMKTPSEVVYPTEWPNLFHMPVGKTDGSSPKLICAHKDIVERIFNCLRQQFDIVIVDSCPVLPVVDTLVVGQFADVAVMSMMRDVSQGQQVLEAQERLKQIGINVFGAVMTAKGSGVYNSHYYSAYMRQA
jgi:capsular exopolysaccharide synthesis family protein